MQCWQVFGKTEILTSDWTVSWHYFGKQSSSTYKNLTFAYSCLVISIPELGPTEKPLRTNIRMFITVLFVAAKKLEHLVNQLIGNN